MKDRFILIIIVATIAAIQFVMGLYLPALPAIAKTFHVSDAIMQQSFTLLTLAYGTSQLFYGPLSDHYGRKPLLLIGMVILLMSTIWALVATSLTSFLTARFIEGLGAGSASVLARSIVADRFRGSAMREAMALLVFAGSITPAIIPFVGGLFEQYLHWRYIFIFLTSYLCILIFFYLLEITRN